MASLIALMPWQDWRCIFCRAQVAYLWQFNGASVFRPGAL